jgi:hypothetical protein
MAFNDEIYFLILKQYLEKIKRYRYQLHSLVFKPFSSQNIQVKDPIFLLLRVKLPALLPNSGRIKVFIFIAYRSGKLYPHAFYGIVDALTNRSTDVHESDMDIGIQKVERLHEIPLRSFHHRK